MKAHPLIDALSSSSPEMKAGALERFCEGATPNDIALAASSLGAFARGKDINVHHKARALFQAGALYGGLLQRQGGLSSGGQVPPRARRLYLEGRFEEAIELLLARATQTRLSEALASALASAYRGLGFQSLAREVQRAVRQQPGNRWMFRISHPLDHPLRLRRELLVPDTAGRYPVLVERTPVRMDLTHSGYSDIFALAMEEPEGARVLNVSVDLAVHGRAAPIAPPIGCWLRVIEEPVLRLCSVDLEATADLEDTSEVFDFARDPLGLLKAAVVASGIVPPGFEGSGQPLSRVLEALLGGPERGLELVSHVAGIPKHSRLAVSTNLLASLIALCMRASSQIASLEGPPNEGERRTVAARAILGEWLGGSGGGWQDSGGVWPGIKRIEGVPAAAGDVEFGTSRGRLLPRHTVLGTDAVSDEARQNLRDCLVVAHGGMGANVGPILEMVTERFLLGSEREWRARRQLFELFDETVNALCRGDMRRLGQLTTLAFEGPLQVLMPEVSNAYTERLIAGARHQFADRFWGFWMMGGMAGGGMGFVFDPRVKANAEEYLLELMRDEKRALGHGSSFAMDPVLYQVAINEVGTTATLRTGHDATLPPEYYLLMLPRWLQTGSASFSAARHREIEDFSSEHLRSHSAEKVGPELITRLFRRAGAERDGRAELDVILADHGFDAELHEHLRCDLKAGRIGLSQNRIPPETVIEDAGTDDVMRAVDIAASTRRLGEDALRRGKVAVITLAAGAGSRWTRGAGTVKALSPFAKLRGRFRTFMEVHLAKSRQTARTFGRVPAQVFTTGHLTHAPLAAALPRVCGEHLRDAVRLSPARSIGLRLVPTRCDLEFSWREAGAQRLEERKQKLEESARAALIEWVARAGEVTDYREGPPDQCVYPLGHWYEVANLLQNGTLLALLSDNPALDHLLLHNIDTVGAGLDAGWLGCHIESQRALNFEVVRRHFDDRGGGLARVAGRLRLIESLALPREEDELVLSHYNTLTTWISIDPLLAAFGLTRQTLADPDAIARGVRALSARMPTYVTLKQVRKRWSESREETHWVAQCEKLWGDMSALPDASVGYFLVPRSRGQQLKEPSQLDVWRRDGSVCEVERLCDF